MKLVKFTVHGALMRVISRCTHDIISYTTQPKHNFIYLSDKASWYFILSGFFSSLRERISRRETTSVSEEEVAWSLSWREFADLILQSSLQCWFTSNRFSLSLCRSAGLLFSVISDFEFCFEDETGICFSLSSGKLESELVSLTASVGLLRLRAKRDELGTLEFTVFTFPDPVSDFVASTAIVFPLFNLSDSFETGLLLLGESVFKFSLASSRHPSISSRALLGEPEFRCRELKRFPKPPNLLPGRDRSGWLFCKTDTLTVSRPWT